MTPQEVGWLEASPLRSFSPWNDTCQGSWAAEQGMQPGFLDGMAPFEEELLSQLEKDQLERQKSKEEPRPQMDTDQRLMAILEFSKYKFQDKPAFRMRWPGGTQRLAEVDVMIAALHRAYNLSLRTIRKQDEGHIKISADKRFQVILYVLIIISQCVHCRLQVLSACANVLEKAMKDLPPQDQIQEAEHAWAGKILSMWKKLAEDIGSRSADVSDKFLKKILVQFGKKAEITANVSKEWYLFKEIVMSLGPFQKRLRKYTDLWYSDLMNECFLELNKQHMHFMGGESLFP